MNLKDFLKRFLPCIGLVVSVLLILLCFNACKTVEYITETEYVPVYTDYTDIIDPVLLLKPNNETYTIRYADNLPLIDIVYNSTTFLKAWQNWQLYADALESTLISIRDTNLAHINN